MVTPSYCLTLIDELERKMGRRRARCSLRLGVFGAEPWTGSLRHESGNPAWASRLWTFTACRK